MCHEIIKEENLLNMQIDDQKYKSEAAVRRKKKKKIIKIDKKKKIYPLLL